MSTISDAIKEDHRELEEYYDKIINSNDHDEKTRYQNLFVWELARHAVAEEIVVYPVMEKVLGAKGKALADKDREDHINVKQQLYEFQSLNSTDEKFLPAIKALYKDMEKHNKEEETDDLPPLEEKLDRDESRDLAKSFERTKKFVPTHSHPSAPNKPPFETAVAFLAAPVDKLMDLFKKFPQD